MSEYRFFEREAIFHMRYSDLENLVAFIRNHEWEEIPESIQNVLPIYEDFLADNL